MQSHGSTLDANFTKVSNDLLNRSDLEFGAKGLHAYFLVRKGWRRADIKTLSLTFGESQAKIAKWMRQLAALGYLIRRKVRDAQGHWKTMVHAFDTPRDVPGADMSSVTVDVLAGQSSTDFPSLGQPSLGSPSVPPSGDKTGSKTPPTPAPAPEPAGPEKAGEDSAMSEGHAASAAVLREIGQRDKRLRLNGLQMMPLLPLVASWRERGVSDGQIIQACTERLPDNVLSPVKLLTYRLGQPMPTQAPAPRVEPSVADVLVRPEPKKGECEECGRPMIRRCMHCEGLDHQIPDHLMKNKLKGIDMARQLLAAKGLGQAA